MNKDRRKKLQEAESMINKAKDIIYSVQIDEQIAFDNLSEGLQQTLRGEQMESNIDVMDEMLEQIDELLEQFNEVE